MNFNAEVFQATQDIQVNQAGQAIHIIQASQASEPSNTSTFFTFPKMLPKIFQYNFFLHLASAWFRMTMTKKVVFVARSPSLAARQRKGTILL